MEPKYTIRYNGLQGPLYYLHISGRWIRRSSASKEIIYSWRRYFGYWLIPRRGLKHWDSGHECCAVLQGCKINYFCSRFARTCESHIDCTTQKNRAHLSQHKSHVASIATLSYSQNQCFQLTPLTLSHPLSNAPTTSSGSGPFSRSTRLLSKRAALLAPIKTASPVSPPSRL